MAHVKQAPSHEIDELHLSLGDSGRPTQVLDQGLTGRNIDASDGRSLINNRQSPEEQATFRGSEAGARATARSPGGFGSRWDVVPL